MGWTFAARFGEGKRSWGWIKKWIKKCFLILRFGERNSNFVWKCKFQINFLNFWHQKKKKTTQKQKTFFHPTFRSMALTESSQVEDCFSSFSNLGFVWNFKLKKCFLRKQFAKKHFSKFKIYKKFKTHSLSNAGVLACRSSIFFSSCCFLWVAFLVLEELGGMGIGKKNGGDGCLVGLFGIWMTGDILGFRTSCEIRSWRLGNMIWKTQSPKQNWNQNRRTISCSPALMT